MTFVVEKFIIFLVLLENKGKIKNKKNEKVGKRFLDRSGKNTGLREIAMKSKKK